MLVVTGGAGFIGSNILAGLEDRGAGTLVVVDDLGCDDKWRNIAKRDIDDVIRPAALMPFLARHHGEVEAVIHMGANSSTTERDVDLILAQNLRPTLDLWDWASAHGKRLIYASSAATYGDGSAGFDDDATPQALARLRPLNPYGWSKHAADRRFARTAIGGGPTPAQWVGLKFFNVYGPNEAHKGGMRSVAKQVFEQASEGARPRLFRSHRPDYEDGGQLRDFVWVDDCVDVIAWALETPDVSGIYNLGTGRARSFRDVARAVLDAMGKPPEVDYIPMPESLQPRYQYFTEARMDRLRQAGYTRPFTSLEDGAAAYVRDYLSQDDPYR